MDSVKMKFARALCLSMGLAAAESVFAQSSNASAALSATVDGVRGRCGLGLLARTTSSQTCQSFRDYGSRMQCVANDLSDDSLAKDSPLLAEVARCYRDLGDALVSGRGANNDQVNALEDICRNLRHETVAPRLPRARDALLVASDALMPGFSRQAVTVPTTAPMMGIRLHDLPDCAVVLSVPAGGAPSVAGTPGPNRVSRAGDGASTSAVQSPRFAYLEAPGGDLAPASSPTPIQAVSASLAESQTISEAGATPASKPVALAAERPRAEKMAEVSADRTVGKSKSRAVASDANASAPISESAVINALPSMSASGRKPARRTTARVERSSTGYGVAGDAERTRSTPRSLAGANAGTESQSGARSSSSYGSGYTASSPPSLPLMGPPLRPQTAGSVR